MKITGNWVTALVAVLLLVGAMGAMADEEASPEIATNPDTPADITANDDDDETTLDDNMVTNSTVFTVFDTTLGTVVTTNVPQ